MERLEQTSQELATIYQTGKIISSGKSLTQIIREVQEELLLAIPEANAAATFVYNQFNEDFDPAGAAEGTKEIGQQHPLVNALLQNPSGMVMHCPEDIAAVRDDSFNNASSLLAIPFFNNNRMEGFILLWNTNTGSMFKNSHQVLVAAVGSQLAAAIENIRYQQEERDRQRLNNAKQTY
jgi:GAF domain-containing protein